MVVLLRVLSPLNNALGLHSERCNTGERSRGSAQDYEIKNLPPLASEPR